jgi:flagellar protein FliO/FliZ
MPMKATYILLDSFEEKIVDGVNRAQTETTPESFSTTNNVLQLLGLVVLLIIILIAAYYTSRFVGRYKLGQLKNSNIQVIEIHRISNSKMLQIIKIANKYVAIGVSKDNITFITEIDEGEVLTHEFNEGEKESFRQIFDKIKGKKE